jgi:hypothetical protein
MGYGGGLIGGFEDLPQLVAESVESQQVGLGGGPGIRGTEGGVSGEKDLELGQGSDLVSFLLVGVDQVDGQLRRLV